MERMAPGVTGREYMEVGEARPAGPGGGYGLATKMAGDSSGLFGGKLLKPVFALPRWVPASSRVYARHTRPVPTALVTAQHRPRRGHWTGHGTSRGMSYPAALSSHRRPLCYAPVCATKPRHRSSRKAVCRQAPCDAEGHRNTDRRSAYTGALDRPCSCREGCTSQPSPTERRVASCARLDSA
jgi:hypothetical protein